MFGNGLKVTLVTLVVLTAAYALYRWVAVAAVEVTSEPTGAVVSINGERVGVTPLQADVPTGALRIEVAHSHFTVHRELIDFARGDRVRRHVTLEPGIGSLRLLSNPKGAWVEIDGERVPGVTPLRLELRSGPHEVLMGQDERKPRGELVQVIADKTVELNLDLPIDPHGSLTVLTEPRGASVELIDSPLKYSPKMRVPVGEYGVAVSHPGHVTQNLRFVVRYGNNVKTVSLQREFGTLTMDVVPDNADVRVIYREGGRTISRGYEPAMQVPTGAVEVRARAMLHRTAFREFDMTNAGHQIKLRLAPMDVVAGSSLRDRLTYDEEEYGPELVVIPAGSFVMGNADGPPSEQPAHRVTLTQPFAMSKYEITVGEYLRYLDAVGEEPSGKMETTDTNLPAHMVSWDDAQGYVRWLTRHSEGRYRLPSEAEWEYAARAGTNSDYYFGSRPEEACAYANLADRTTGRAFREWRVVDCEDGHVRLAPVGQFRPNGFGLYDMTGNVSEWVAECGMPSYRTAPNDGSVARGDPCTTHGHRGGSWDSQPVELQSAYRNTAGGPNQDRGFRIVRDL